MWTPRRILLLLGGVLLFGAVYASYTLLLGWLDGLPQLPAKMLVPAKDQPDPPVRTELPTVKLLNEAFGPNCPEGRDDKVYETKLTRRNGASSVVLASGPPPSNPNSNRITLSPFSLAVFGKPRPEYLRQPGEVVEITTFHADKAVLEFDRVITNANDMGKAKLLRVELVSDPEQAPPDPRRGTVHITNNHRSADPNKFLVLRTPGPVFFRDPRNVDPEADPGAASGPDIWSDAAVELIDRQNLPRAYGAASPPTAPVNGADLRDDPAAVPEILAGRRLPPPTVTGVGLRIFLEPEPKQQPGAPLPKKSSSAFGGVRRVELQEKVLFNLWVDASRGFVGSPSTPDTGEKAGGPLAPFEPPAATAAVTGGLFVAVQNTRQLDRALLQIDTLGPFAYDAEKNLARFDVVPQANPSLPNDVQVTRIPPRGGQQRLFSQVLEVEFNGPPTGPQQGAEPRPAAPPAAKTGKPKADEPGGPSFKRLHAWTYTPGRSLTVLIAEKDQRGEDTSSLLAYGQDLVYEQAAGRTTLQGTPLQAVRQNPPAPGDKPGEKKPGGRSILSAGAPHQPAVLTLEPGPDRTTVTTVKGAGRIELLEAGANTTAVTATWQNSLTHVKEAAGRRDLDRLTFDGGARFDDNKAGFWLQGKVLTLWLEPGRKPEGAADGPPDTATGTLPHRVQALEEVSGHSTDFDIEKADHLTVYFRDGVPPPERPRPPEPKGPVPLPGPMGPMPLAGPLPPADPPKEPQRPKPPMKLTARVIDTWMVRYPVPKEDEKKPDPKAAPQAAQAGVAAGPAPGSNTMGGQPGEGSVRYELEKARCEGGVVVHQDPVDPDKPRGVDIFGQTLLIDHTPYGGVMTVTGTDDKPGQVHHEGMSIIGPKVVIDQIHNLAVVEGRGSMVMPAGSDFSGSELGQPSVVVVHWRDRMEFSGAKKTAEFLGKVTAHQNESYVACHTLQVVLDRPVSFNQARKPVGATAAGPRAANDGKGPNGPKQKDDPKIEVVYCYPAPEDARDEPRGSNRVTYTEVVRDETGRVVKTQQVTAREMVMTAQARDEARGDPYQKVVADGPGTVRIWQPGQKDLVGPGPAAGGNGQPSAGAPAKPAGTEMKLTVVTFGGRMTVKDKGKIYQEAVFDGNGIDVIHAPAEDAAARIERHRLPHGSIVLTCANRLVVSTHRQKDGPPAQRMDAYGNAYIRSDEYDGWGEVINYDGRFVTLEGSGNSLARIQSRFKGNEQPGKKIIYDRVKNSYEVQGSPGGTFQQNPAPKGPGPGRP